MTEEIIHIDNEDLVGIYGVNDENIQLLRKIFLQKHYTKYNQLTDNDILYLNENKDKWDKAVLESGDNKDIILHGREGKIIRARTPNQIRLTKSIINNDMVFAVGPAGTGKTYTAVALLLKR